MSMFACCGTPLWRQSRSEVLEVTEVVRSLAEDSLSSPGKRPSLICTKWQERKVTLCALPQSFFVLPYVHILTYYLIQLYVGQAGSRATAIFLRIRHSVAVQSQQLLQRKLSSLQGVTWRIERLQVEKKWHFTARLHDSLAAKLW